MIFRMRAAGIGIAFAWFSSAALAQAPVIPCISSPAGGCTAVTSTNPLPMAIYGNGSAAQVSLDGSLSVNTPASPQFQDSFSTALDTTTNWTAKNSTGTAATASGQLVINSSTTASAWGGVSTQQTFAPVGVGSQVWGVLASFTVLAQANSVRVFGVFTVPATPTTAVPVTDGYIYRLDGTGALFAEIWSGGVAVSSTNVTTACLPAANFPGIFAIVYRANLVQFTCGSALVVNQAPILGINPANQVLPLSALSIAGSTPPAASAVMNLSALALGVISPAAIKSSAQAPTINDPAEVVALRPNSAGTVSGSLTNPSSTLTLPVTTTAYTSGQLIANSATAGSVVNPSFSILNTAGGASIGRLRLSINDTTSTAWAGQTIQVDLWTATPTWTNGDRGTWLPATGAASHLASYACVLPTPVWGDGLGTECSLNTGNFAGVKLASGSSIFWSLKASTGSGVTGASGVFTIIAEPLN